MNNTPSTPTSPPATPPKLWLWLLAVLPAAVLLALASVGFAEELEDTILKAACFTAAMLCGAMDIRVLRKTGHEVPRWWWGLACFLPPAYMLLRVHKTDTAPSDRIRRYAPLLLWILLWGALLGAGLLLESDAPQDLLEARAGTLLQEGLADHFADSGLDCLTPGRVGNLTLVHEYGNKYTGLADVELHSPNGQATIRYELTATADGDQLLLEFAPTDSHLDKFIAFVERSGCGDDE